MSNRPYPRNYHTFDCSMPGCPVDPLCGYGACLHGPRGDGTDDPCPPDAAQQGVGRIAAERQRQIDVENYTPEHDAQHHAHGELIHAAVAYAMWVPEHINAYAERDARDRWPFTDGFKPDPDDPIHNLVKAGALIAAEIDRLLSSAHSDGDA